jgi:hexosaminidase
MLRSDFRWPRVAAILIGVLGASSALQAAAPMLPAVMPTPAEVRLGEGRLAITAALTVSVAGHSDSRLQLGIARALRRWEERTGFTFARTPAGEYATLDASGASTATLLIHCNDAGLAVPTLGENEAYSLEVTGTQATLRAETAVGVLRGLETLLQLLQADAHGWFVSAMSIRDQPRFAWRGLLIDPGRHWLPVDVIKRTLDGMALVKLNVLHFHLSEDQGFRVESRKYPKLHELGSDGDYYTQEQITDIVSYAAERGIRVVPEFDVPGHATSWLVGYPEIASAAGPYAIERRWGIKDPVLDPTNEKTYELLDGLFGEMATLFPDAYFHIGGDENNGKHWSANANIQAFIAQHELKNNEGLHTYFNTRLRQILAKHGKKLVGWDEILHPDLPKDSVVQSWRGAQGLAAAAKGGFPVLLSNGYYLDHCLPAARHYANDPVPADSPLTPDERQRVLGGEACMWGEWVTPETIDSRIWPRAAAVAERLWSPREMTDTADMYRRLGLVSRRLEEAGTLHEKNPAAMLRRYAGEAVDEAQFSALRTFATLTEAGALGVRSRAAHGTVTQASPLTMFADCVKPESDTVREFTNAVDALLFTPAARNAALTAALSRQLDGWRSAANQVATDLAPRSPRLGELTEVATTVAQLAALGRELLAAVADGNARDDAWAKEKFAVVAQATQPNNLGVTLPMIPSLRLLVAAAVAAPQRATLGGAEWRAAVEKIATPPRPAARPPTPAPPATPK